MPTYDDFCRMLTVNKHRLDDDLEIQADYMERISRMLTSANATARETKDVLVGVEGKLMSALKEGTVKSNAEERAGRVRNEPDRLRAWKNYQEAIVNAEKWSHLYDSWKQRGKDLQELGRLYSANYFQVNSVGRDQNMDDRRAAMRAVSTSREDRAVDAARASAEEAGIIPRRQPTSTVERMRERVTPATPTRKRAD